MILFSFQIKTFYLLSFIFYLLSLIIYKLPPVPLFTDITDDEYDEDNERELQDRFCNINENGSAANNNGTIRYASGHAPCFMCEAAH
ncbi:MAG: hypothetical protein Ta2B_24480 [Termitinemataceae bacterium]|nr:MAG: hypothetical protein Ta2B_24480 [Termitinemataceae bacterium]